MSFFAPEVDFLSHFLSGHQPPHHEHLVDGARIIFRAAGVLEIAPETDNSQYSALILSAGVHGNETAPIEILNNLVSRIMEQSVSVAQPVLIILGNLEAMHQATRFVEHNMNRLFSGQHLNKADCYETRRAAELERVIDDFVEKHQASYLLHLDLHTAIRGSFRERFAIYPFSPKRKISDQELGVLSGCGVNTVLIMENSGPTYSSYSGLKWGAQSFTVELGRVAPFGENNLASYQNVSNCLAALISDTDLNTHPERVEQFRVAEVIEHTGNDFKLNISEDGFNFTQYDAGDWVWKGAGKQYLVSDKPQYLVFPNTKVAAGERAGLLVERI